MRVKDQIKVLEKALKKLSALDPHATVAGHIACPSTGYWGDLDGEIFKIKVVANDTEGWDKDSVVLEIHYK